MRRTGSVRPSRLPRVKPGVAPQDEGLGSAAHTCDAGRGESAAALLERAFGFRGLLDAVLELLDDQRQVLGLRARILRVLPLEARLEVAPDLPIGVAEMVIDDRIAGLELDRLLELLHRLVVMAEAVMGPA